MNIYIKYDEEITRGDELTIPETCDKSLELLQKEFLKWMFDKDVDHKYWKVINDVKVYCEYDSTAFVDWLNSNVFIQGEKASVLKKDIETDNKDFEVLYF